MLQLHPKLFWFDVVAKVMEVLPADHRQLLEILAGAHAHGGAELVQGFLVVCKMLLILCTRLADIKRRVASTPPKSPSLPAAAPAAATRARGRRRRAPLPVPRRTCARLSGIPVSPRRARVRG